MYEFTRQLLQYGQVSDTAYQALHQSIGTAPIVELTAVIGYYTMVAMTLNVHQVPLPEGDKGTLLDLPEGQTLVPPTPLPKGLLSNELKKPEIE